MNANQESIQALQDIKTMMERSSRFISLSGLSGVAAGISALIGAGFAHRLLDRPIYVMRLEDYTLRSMGYFDPLTVNLLWIAGFTLAAAVLSAFIFTYIRSRKTNIPMWGKASKRLVINAAIPLLAGGIFLLKLLWDGQYGYIAPGCLIFYGLALVNASKYTVGDIRYLGFTQIILGIVNLWFIGYGLYFWAMGFGILHILYGTSMWWKYERKSSIENN